MVSIVVVDNSVLLPLVFHDEDPIPSRELILAGASSLRLLAPSLCMLEFGNAILNGFRRQPQRMTPELAALAFGELQNLPISFRESASPSSLARIGTRALRLGLSFYDAVYVELAISENAMLATFDKKMADTAQSEGIKLWQWGTR